MDQTTQQTGQIYSLLPKVMNSIGAVGKSRYAKMPQGGYNFRGIDDLYNAVQPALIAHGVSIVPVTMNIAKRETIAREGKGALFYTIVEARYRFYAPDGSYVEATTVGEAMDSGDKGCNKAMSAAMKYALFQVLCIPTEEPKDSENDTHELPPAEELPSHKPNIPVGDQAMIVGAMLTRFAKLNGLDRSQPDTRRQFVEFAVLETESKSDLSAADNWTEADIRKVGTALRDMERETVGAK